MSVPKFWRTVRYRPAFRRFTPRSMHVTGAHPYPEGPGPRAAAGAPASVFIPDGFVYPRPGDVFFDAVVRVPSIAPSSTVTQLVFTQEERIKQGWIRKLGYNFNSPHGFFQVRTFLQLAGGVPTNYIYKTVDPSLPGGQYQGSFPVEQIGSVLEPTDVYILLPSNVQVEIRFQNNSTVETFSAEVRLWGWSQGS